MSLSFDTLSGNYSSGTVRDFHPIPFSSGMPVGRQDTCYGTKIVFLYGLAKVFSFLFAEFQYARFGCDDVHPVSDKNQGLIAIMVTDILP